MKPLVLALLFVAACSSGSSTAATTTTSAASASPTTAAAKTYASADDVIAAINAGGVTCTASTSSERASGGVATLGFCKVDTHRVQVLTFLDDNGKKSWLKAADQAVASIKGQEYDCVVGTNYAACPDPGPGSKLLGGRIASIIGGEEVKSPT